MDKDTEKLENTSNKPVKPLRDENGKLLPNQPSLNPNGRPTGAENFATKWRRAVEKIGSQNGMTADEIEQQLLLVGYKKAKDGDYRFYQDVFDRVYGKPTPSNEILDKPKENVYNFFFEPKFQQNIKNYDQHLKEKILNVQQAKTTEETVDSD